MSWFTLVSGFRLCVLLRDTWKVYLRLDMHPGTSQVCNPLPVLIPHWCWHATTTQSFEKFFFVLSSAFQLRAARAAAKKIEADGTGVDSLERSVKITADRVLQKVTVTVLGLLCQCDLWHIWRSSLLVGGLFSIFCLKQCFFSKMVYQKESFPSKESNTKILQSICFAY